LLNLSLPRSFNARIDKQACNESITDDFGNSHFFITSRISDSILTLSYLSKNGEEGYPGNLKVFVTYTLSNNDELIISYKAKTDKKTICNLTQHNYYNLNGHDSGDILSHKLMINADNFIPIDAGFIPTGKIIPVKNTAFDFTKPTAIGKNVKNKDEQLIFGKGYDHNFVLNKKGKKGEMTFAASVFEPKSGRFMEVFTEEPGLQFYGGNFLDGSNIGKNGTVYNFRNAFCLESQHYPDSPNKPNFPSVVLKILPTNRTFLLLC